MQNDIKVHPAGLYLFGRLCLSVCLSVCLLHTRASHSKTESRDSAKLTAELLLDCVGFKSTKNGGQQ